MTGARSERFVVTGAAGFIGSNLVRRLLEEGCSVVGVDNFATGRRENLAELAGSFKFVEGDIGEAAIARNVLNGADYILHQAAIPSVPRSVADPQATNYSCIDTTLQVLLCARDFGVKRVVVAASSSAYGDTEVLPKVETMTPKPLSPYAASKLAQEYYCAAFSTCYGVETVALRYFNVFGPRQDPKSDYAAVIPKFIRLMLAGKRPTVYGDGEQSRDFTFIDDVVSANLLAARAGGMFLGEVINIARGERITVNNLVKKINAVLGTDFEPEYVDPIPGDVKHSLADISRASELIGYQPTTTIEAGLEKTAAWVKENLSASLNQ